ncbi:flagellar basal body L-ring protein FlgH [bacterium]|nr:flagellar basal body L-ring protein FlgH [bacterium]
MKTGYIFRSLWFVFLVLCPVFCGFVSAEESLSSGWSGSLYSDVKAYKVGDVISVIISESNSATKNTKTDTKKQNKSDAKGEASGGALRGLFPGVSGSLDVSNQYGGQGSTVRNGSLSSRITVKVIDVLPDNNLVIEGSKTLELNEDIEVINISGLVRPQDISSQNTVYSYQVANAKITYKGKGSVSDAQRPGLLMRIINWIL